MKDQFDFIELRYLSTTQKNVFILCREIHKTRKLPRRAVGGSEKKRNQGQSIMPKGTHCKGILRHDYSDTYIQIVRKFTSWGQPGRRQPAHVTPQFNYIWRCNFVSRPPFRSLICPLIGACDRFSRLLLSDFWWRHSTVNNRVCRAFSERFHHLCL